MLRLAAAARRREGDAREALRDCASRSVPEIAKRLRRGKLVGARAEEPCDARGALRFLILRKVRAAFAQRRVRCPAKARTGVDVASEFFRHFVGDKCGADRKRLVA